MIEGRRSTSYRSGHKNRIGGVKVRNKQLIEVTFLKVWTLDALRGSQKPPGDLQTTRLDRMLKCHAKLAEGKTVEDTVGFRKSRN